MSSEICLKFDSIRTMVSCTSLSLCRGTYLPIVRQFVSSFSLGTSCFAFLICFENCAEVFDHEGVVNLHAYVEWFCMAPVKQVSHLLPLNFKNDMGNSDIVASHVNIDSKPCTEFDAGVYLQ